MTENLCPVNFQEVDRTLERNRKEIDGKVFMSKHILEGDVRVCL